MTDTTKQLEFRAVTAANWRDFERLFESRGGPKWCWCMVWRDLPVRGRKDGDVAKKTAIRSIVESGTPVGILGYGNGEPVGWCSIAPRPTYRKGLARGFAGTDAAGEDPDDVWSLVCFYVRSRVRGTGIGRQLLSAAIMHAKANGAKVVEAYPVDTDSPSYLFMGFVPMFVEAGFEPVGRVGSRRHVMRLTV